MKKARITLCKRIIVDSTTTDPTLKNLYDKVLPALSLSLKNILFSKYSILDNAHMDSQLIGIVNRYPNEGLFLSIAEGLKYIPQLEDDTRRKKFPIVYDNTRKPCARAEVISYEEDLPANFSFALYFETESLVLLDSIGNKLLLSTPNGTGEEDSAQSYFENTFFITLTDDLYFKDYEIL